MALEHIERRAARMRARREELGLSQEAVADRMQDIHAEHHPDEPRDRTRGQMVSDWERAVNEPSPKKIELLAAALSWTVGDLNSDAVDESTETPDVLGALSSDQARLERIEAKLDRLLDHFDLAELEQLAAGAGQARDRGSPRTGEQLG